MTHCKENDKSGVANSTATCPPISLLVKQVVASHYIQIGLF